MTRSMGSWASRLLGGALGVLVAVAVLGFLGVAGVVIWAVNVSVPGHQRETTEAEKESARQAAALAQQTLTAAAADGRLTDEEIRAAVGGPVWDLRRTDPVWVLRARFDGTEPVCFSYDITAPLGPATRVTGFELPVCPDITPS